MTTKQSFLSVPLLAKRALGSRLLAKLSYPHGVDHYLEYLNPRWSLEEVRAEVTAKRCQTADTITLTLRPNHVWAGAKPGQFVRLSVSVDGRLQTRCFSPAQSQHAADGQIEITAKLHAEAHVTRYLRDQLEIGDVVTLSQADGVFALPDERPQRLLLISGGSGITPVMAMLRTLVDEHYQGEVTFLHYANNATEQLYAAELTTLVAALPKATLLRCYRDGTAGELQGLFSAAQLQQAVPDFTTAETFLCGPPGLMGAVEQVYQAHGITEKLHLERFVVAATVPASVASDSAVGDVHFSHSECYAANSGKTLLEQAEEAGLAPTYGCRMGICYACTCHKSAGQVLDTRTGKVSDAGAGDIQICCSVPVGDVVIDL